MAGTAGHRRCTRTSRGPFVFTEEDAIAIRAETNARVLGPFPGHLFTWHGTRTILGLRWLREALA